MISFAIYQQFRPEKWKLTAECLRLIQLDFGCLLLAFAWGLALALAVALAFALALAVAALLTFIPFSFFTFAALLALALLHRNARCCETHCSQVTFPEHSTPWLQSWRLSLSLLPWPLSSLWTPEAQETLHTRLVHRT